MGTKATEADLEKAFTAGYNDQDIELGPSAELTEEELAAQAAAQLEANSEAPADGAPAADAPAADAPAADAPAADAPAADEWEGVPDTIKSRIEDLTSQLENVTNIANSASGRANKLQSKLDKQNVEQQAPAAAAKPTSEQLLEAMASSEKRDKLGEDFPEFVAVFEEMDRSVSNSVGTAMDGLREDLMNEARNINSSAMSEYEIKRNLDNKHPGWENTVQDVDFKTWAYEGGPSEQERLYYESLITQAAQAAPEQSAEMYDNANAYFNSMLDNHPVWANAKGNLYGDPSGDAAISLLDLYKESKPADPAPAPAAQAPAPAPSDTRFEDGLTPTHGKGRQAPTQDAADVEKAFSEGFNS